jgi:DNA-binding XRE family transcriptional regulator
VKDVCVERGERDDATEARANLASCWFMAIALNVIVLQARPEPGDLADKVAATRQTINAIEKEKYAPSLELAFRIADAFGAPFEKVWWFEA